MGVLDGEAVGVADGVAVALADIVGDGVGAGGVEVDALLLHPVAKSTAASIAVQYQIACRRSIPTPDGHESFPRSDGARPVYPSNWA